MGPRQRQGHGRSKTHALPVILLSLLGFLLIAGVAFGIGMIGNVNRWLSDLPDYTDANAYLVSEPTEIVDCNGNKIASFYTQNRKSITKDQVSPYVLQGTIDVEDERFYEHGGIDLLGIARASVATLAGGHEGASTITQQLVRNTILQEEQFDSTIERKVREAYIAIKMEDMYSKDEILMMYLNTIYYGHGAYGIEAAAETYLSKSASDLTLSEAALLIGLPNSPSQYDPTVNPDLALSRRNKVLDNMLRLGHITQEEHDAAQAEPITLNVPEISGSGVDVYSQPYFVSYVKQLLEQEFSTDVLFKGGLTVKTTIDPTMQQGNDDDCIYLPYTTAMRLSQKSTADSYICIMVDENQANEAKAAVEQGLYDIFKSDSAYYVYSASEWLEEMNEMINMVIIILTGIASISLLVGGIGIMNIMLVSVTERTREIGIRKALGAKERVILSQFVVEAATTSALGGVLGIVLGYIVSMAANRILPMISSSIDVTVSPSFNSIVVAFGISVGIGVLFGYLPAKRAARLNPIEALRYD